MRKIVFIMSFLLVMVVSTACSNTVDKKTTTTESLSKTESQTTQSETVLQTEIEVVDDSWKDIFISHLKNDENSENYEYNLVFVDGDDIPELYKHGKQRPTSSKLCWIYEDDVYSQEMFVDGFEYIEKENLFMSTGVQSGVQGDYVYKINGTEAEELSSGIASRMIQGQEKYTWNDEVVSESEYNTLRAKAFDVSKAKGVDEYYSIDEIIDLIQQY